MGSAPKPTVCPVCQPLPILTLYPDACSVQEIYGRNDAHEFLDACGVLVAVQTEFYAGVDCLRQAGRLPACACRSLQASRQGEMAAGAPLLPLHQPVLRLICFPMNSFPPLPPLLPQDYRAQVPALLADAVASAIFNCANLKRVIHKKAVGAWVTTSALSAGWWHRWLVPGTRHRMPAQTLPCSFTAAPILPLVKSGTRAELPALFT